ncbi:MAG: STAS domain-containing protein, partial [Actinomycetota bacterium]|nr:STAS domain-containing protein [Actinomycetota bacterium]
LTVTSTGGDDANKSSVVSVCGDLAATSASELLAALRSVVDARLVILNLLEVGSIDPAGIGALIGGIRAVDERGGLFIIVIHPGRTFGLLERAGISRLALVLPAFDDAKTPVSISHTENGQALLDMATAMVVNQ